MLEILVVLVAVAIGAFLKGATGQGLPQIAIPVMAVFVGVEHAVVIMAIPTVVTNVWLMWAHRNHFRATRDLPGLLLTGIVGTVLGTWALTVIDARILSLVVGALVAGYVMLSLLDVGLHLTVGVSRITSLPTGFLAGSLQGVTGVSGPLLSAYLHAYRLKKEAYVLSLVTLFQAYAVVQVIALAQLGLYSGRRLLESLIALGPIMMVLPIGSRVGRRLSPRTFDVWILVLLALTAAKLLYDGLLA